MEEKIKLIYPENNSEISLVDKVIEEFTDNYYHHCSEKLFDKGVKAEEPLFKWEKIENATYELLLSAKVDLSDAEVYKTDKNEAFTKPLYMDTRYYWSVRAVTEKTVYASSVYTFKTKAYPRAINAEGCGNLRDIGGMKLKDGKRIRQGLVYRSSYLHKLTENGKKKLTDALKIKTELDLRTAGEDGAGEGSSLGKNVNYINIGGSFYMDISKDEGTLAEEIKVFTDEKNYPLIAHCKSGRDRTGMLFFFLEAILGAEYEDIFADYELSFLSKTACSDKSDWLFVCSQMDDVTDYLMKEGGKKDFCENAVSFLLKHGVTESDTLKIRKLLIED